MEAALHAAQGSARLLDAGFGSGTRALCKAEITALEAGGNRSIDTGWANVRVLLDVSRWDPEHVQRTRFVGRVVLGGFGGHTVLDGGRPIPAGVYDAALADVIVHSGALVQRCGLMSSCIVHAGAMVRDCATVQCSGATSYGNGVEVTVGPETGGREVRITAESDLETTASACLRTAAGCDAAAAWAQQAATFAQLSRGRHTVVGEQARLVGCRLIDAAFVGAGAAIEGSSVTNSTVMGSIDRGGEPGGSGGVPATVVDSDIRNSIVQRGCRVATRSVVESSLMCEYSHVARHGILMSSVLGPFSGVEEGEVSSSLVGPFVGFHHQALLVAAFWPEGRGNIGYGANVGSNHTGKRNDQEIWPGEGVFYGLGCSIKYPCNLSEAPYTLVATGVTALPQRLSMPFSLMNTPGERIPGVSPSFNEVMPGWVLSDNMYGVFRNTIKFEKRQAAALRRDARAAPSGTVFGFTTEIVRQDTVTLMVTARAALVRVAGKHRLHTAAGHPVYTDSDLAGGLGIGKNYMLEKSRAAAVATYSTYIEFFALQQICKAMQAGRVSLAEVTELLQARATAATATGKHRGAPSLKNKPKTKAMPATGGDLSYRQLGSQFVSLSLTRQAKPPAATLDAGHAYAMELLSQDPALLGGVVTGERLVARFAELLDAQAAAIHSAKAKDFKRGEKIIPDYASVHAALDDDPIVVAARTQAVDFRIRWATLAGKM